MAQRIDADTNTSWEVALHTSDWNNNIIKQWCYSEGWT